MATEERLVHLPIEVQNSGLIPLPKLNDYFSAPTHGSLRQWYFHKKYNVRDFMVKIAGRVYVKIPDFLNWLESQGKTVA